MVSATVRTTVQATILTSASNILAQIIRCQVNQRPVILQLAPVIQFALFAMISTPPNMLWQEFLEDSFPGYMPGDAALQPNAADRNGTGVHEAKEQQRATAPVPQKHFSIWNTVTKFLLDQTFGAVVNTILFIAAMAALRGSSQDQILLAVQNDTWPLLLASYKFWPLVSIIQLVFVPLEYRIIVGSLFGMGWGVFLSLSTQS